MNHTFGDKDQKPIFPALDHGACLHKPTSNLSQVIREHQIHSVVDVGCGDFFIGSQIAPLVSSYVGVDIVPSLVAQNQAKYGVGGISFLCRDAVSDDLPPAQLCLIRQVFQHLSNNEIAQVIEKLTCYDYVLVTEHYPAPAKRTAPNKDKPHGPDTRIYDGSAVYLDQPPFALKVRELLCVRAQPCLVAEGETLRTFLVTSPRVC